MSITDKTMDRILAVRRKTGTFFVRIYTRGSFMDFDLDDSRLLADIEENCCDYLLCSRRFEPGKKQSKTGLTSVWFELEREIL